jgi:ATP-dependent DNA ligase
LTVEALAQLKSQSCIIDGEAVACGDDGIPSFERLRRRQMSSRRGDSIAYRSLPPLPPSMWSSIRLLSIE